MVSENKAALIEKLILLERYRSELKELQSVTFHHYRKDTITRRGTERLLQLIVEVASDINGLLLSEKGASPPTSYYDSFVRAGEAGVVNNNLAKKIAPTAGLRSRLVHEYGEYKDVIVFKNIERFLHLYSLYIKEIKTFIKKSTY